MRIKGKFYVGARHMMEENEWAHPTLDKAIEHAKRLVEETNDDQIVVQIVRVVRRRATPVIVEKV